MPNIPNIPDEMIQEHVNWHTLSGNPGAGGRAINPWPQFGPRPALGSGEEFLVWHDGFLERFHQWVDGLPAGDRPVPQSIEPWTSIPSGLKMGMVGWNAQLAQDEARLNNMDNFASLDELGRFLEWSLHNFLHVGSRNMWDEPVILTFESPRSTYFWQLHGFSSCSGYNLVTSWMLLSNQLIVATRMTSWNSAMTFSRFFSGSGSRVNRR